MVYIPAGSFLMGYSGIGDDAVYSDSWELPQHSVYLSAYCIGKYEVTRADYRKFIEAGGYSNPAYWSTEGWKLMVNYLKKQPEYWGAQQDWGTGTFTQTDSHPVVGLTYYEAEAFCNWAGGHLPTGAQWEKAARWDAAAGHSNVYPWGDVWDPEKCNNFWDHNAAGGGYEKNQTAPVGSYPSGASPYGCQDMAGNAYEFCRDWWSSSYYSQTPLGGWLDPQGPSREMFRSLRGGSWDRSTWGYRCAFHYHVFPYGYLNEFGFRLAR